MIRPIVVMHDKQAPKCLYWGIHLGFRITQCRRLGAFLLPSHVRGHHPPLVNVDATDTDKRDELALCLLGEHPSGQRQVGFDKKVVANLLNSLDKREHLSPVDNTVDKLPTGNPSGGLSMSNF